MEHDKTNSYKREKMVSYRINITPTLAHGIKMMAAKLDVSEAHFVREAIRYYIQHRKATWQD